MATSIYKDGHVNLIGGEEVYLKPLKIKYLREFMAAFDLVKEAKTDDQAINVLSHCATIAIRSQYPLIQTKEDFENSVDLPSLYKIIEITAGIKIKEDAEDTVKKQAEDGKSNTWDDLDLAELESEVFLIGIWKDYEELEISLSMPELLATLSAKRDLDYQEKKFFAAIQGVDLDKQNGKSSQNEWEAMKARVFSGGKTSDPNDITAYQGVSAQKAGFGIGMGMGYEDLTEK
jgi:hypothetical protein